MNICVDVRGLLVGVLSLIFFLFIHITYLFTYFTYQQVSPPFLHSKSLTPPPFGPPPLTIYSSFVIQKRAGSP